MNLQEPLVSILTPCYNAEKYIDRYAKALLKKIGFPSELVINYNKEKLFSYFNMHAD